MECILSLVSAGITISDIEACLMERSLQRFFAKWSTWLELLQWHPQLQYNLGTLLVGPVTFPSLDTYQSYFNVLIPSRHAIPGCFLAHFWEKESLYKACMQKTTLGEHEEWLSCDHTFKSVGEYSTRAYHEPLTNLRLCWQLYGRKIDKIGSWFCANLLRPIGPNANVSIPSSPLTILLAGHPLDQVKIFKYLGVLLSHDLSWSDHVQSVCSKARKIFGLLYRQFYNNTPSH